LVDERYRENRPTIISTNYSTQQLKKLFATTGETKEESVRILRRLIGTPATPLAKFFHFKRPATK
jgi:DNA replication protein DnaC